MSETLPVDEQINVSADKVQVTSINIVTDPKGELAVIAAYSTGHETTDPAKFHTLSTERHICTGADLDAIMADYPDLYAQIRTIAYRIRTEQKAKMVK